MMSCGGKCIAIRTGPQRSRRPFFGSRHFAWALAVLQIFTFAVLSPAQAAEKIVFLLPSLASLPAFAPYILAKHKGYLKEEGLDVTFRTGKGGTDVAKQLGAGNADLGLGVGDTAIIVRPNGIPVKSVAVLGGGSLLAIATHDDSEITGPKDLKGKTVTTYSLQDTTYYSLLGTLAAVGLSKDNVKIQAVGPVNVWKLFVARKADAMGAVPDWIAAAERAGAKLKIFQAKDYFPNMPQAIIASEEMIATKPDVVRGFVRATLRSLKDIMDDPEAAAKDYVKAVPQNADRLPQMIRTLQLYASMVYPGQSRLGEIDGKRIAELQDFYFKQGIIDKKSDVKDLYTNAFVP